MFTGPGDDKILLYRAKRGDNHWIGISGPPAGWTSNMFEGYVFANAGPDRTPLYRFWNSEPNDHFYSILPTVPSGYVIEGHEGYVLPSPVSDRLPLYRFYKPMINQYRPDPNTGEYEYGPVEGTDRYFYSTDRTLLSNVPEGYVFGGIEGYVSSTSGPGKTRLFHFYNKTTDDHFTALSQLFLRRVIKMSPSIHNKMFVFTGPGDDKILLYRAKRGDNHWIGISGPPAGWTSNMFEGYVFANAGPDRTPLYRFYNSEIIDHVYSISPTAPTGYVIEGHEGYVFARPGPDRTPLYQFGHAEPEEGRGFLSDVGNFFSDAANAVAGAITTVINIVNIAYESTVGVLVNAVGAAIEYLSSVPVIGHIIRFFGYSSRIVQEVCELGSQRPRVPPFTDWHKAGRSG